jgi:hypothetical protein
MDIAEKKHLRMILFPGHDSAFDFWMRMLFQKEVGDGRLVPLKDMYGKIFGQSTNTHYVETGNFVFNDGSLHTKYDNDIAEVIFGLRINDKTRYEIANLVGRDSLISKETPDGVPQYTQLVANGVRSRITCVNTHEAPGMRVSSLVLGESEAKPTENYKTVECLLRELTRKIGYSTERILWIYGNDGEPVAKTSEFEIVGGSLFRTNKAQVITHHLAELDEKGNPNSTKGGVTYVGHKTGTIFAPGDY